MWETWVQSLGREDSPGEGDPLQYSCLVNPMDGGAWWATVHGVANSRTRLSDFTFTFNRIVIFRWTQIQLILDFQPLTKEACQPGMLLITITVCT